MRERPRLRTRRYWKDVLQIYIFAWTAVLLITFSGLIVVRYGPAFADAVSSLVNLQAAVIAACAVVLFLFSMWLAQP